MYASWNVVAEKGAPIVEGKSWVVSGNLRNPSKTAPVSWTQSIHPKMAALWQLRLYTVAYVTRVPFCCIAITYPCKFYVFSMLCSIIMLWCLVQSLYKATLQLLMLHSYLYVIQLSFTLVALCCFKVYSRCMLDCLVKSLYKAAPLFLLLSICGTQLRLTVLPYNSFILLKCCSEVMLCN